MDASTTIITAAVLSGLFFFYLVFVAVMALPSLVIMDVVVTMIAVMATAAGLSFYYSYVVATEMVGASSNSYLQTASSGLFSNSKHTCHICYTYYI